MERLNIMRLMMGSLLGVGVVFAPSCERSQHGIHAPETCQQIVDVRPIHATRILVEYKTADGVLHVANLHHSNLFICGDITLDPHDYMKRPPQTPMPYGQFDP